MREGLPWLLAFLAIVAASPIASARSVSLTVSDTAVFQCAWIEGTRTFNMLFGAATSAVCFSIAIPILWWVLPKHKRWLFTPNVDGNQRVQLAYGIFCMSMAFTDALCRFIPHQPLAWVHPAFFITTVILAVGLGPRVAYLWVRHGGPSGAAATPYAERTASGVLTP